MIGSRSSLVARLLSAMCCCAVCKAGWVARSTLEGCANRLSRSIAAPKTVWRISLWCAAL